MTKNLLCHLLWRFKFYVLFIGVIIFGAQIFLAYKSLNSSLLSNVKQLSVVNLNDVIRMPTIHLLDVPAIHQNSLSDDEDITLLTAPRKSLSSSVSKNHNIVAFPNDSEHKPINHLSSSHLGFTPNCTIKSREAVSALQRAKTKECRKHIAHIACAIQAGQFYAKNLPSYCPHGNYTANVQLGCYRDRKEVRLLSGYATSFKTSNTVELCIQLCLQSGFPYAGVQFGVECFCGSDSPPSKAKLAYSSCNMKCSGNSQQVCGGYYAMNIYETGISKFSAQIAVTHIPLPTQSVRIAFLLTLNGRALRQVHRLLRVLYAPHHVYYIHVDKRQNYLYRELIQLESKFHNIRLVRNRFSTIWGGASLLTILLQSMSELLQSVFQWDFIINLSESDFPIKTADKLESFLWANRDKNFVKSHGRETQRFIQKQGLDKTFVECDTHMWRIGDRTLPIGIQVDGGSDWVALSRPFVTYIINEMNTDILLKGLLIIFKHTLLPAESFFHTVLRNTQFCNTYIDNNLHVTNWKRKLGCKCQYKHVVDWCGCSPNDFKQGDWSRLKNTDTKMLFFARKFEPIINQGILTKLEEWLFGPSIKNCENLHSYWQSFYHWQDDNNKESDLAMTIGGSLIQRLTYNWSTKANSKLIDLTHYLISDQYKGYLIRYQFMDFNNNCTYELETHIQPLQFTKILKTSKFGKRLKSFEVSSEFDQKEQISRNFAKFLGPYTELVAIITIAASSPNVNKDNEHSYNFTLLWIDPIGRLQDYSELHIEDTTSDHINFSKGMLKQPLMPGIWTVKLIDRLTIYAQSKFLITPFSYHHGQYFTSNITAIINGSGSLSLSNDFVLPSEWLQHLPTSIETNLLLKNFVENILKSNETIDEWRDELINKFHHIRETCIVNKNIHEIKTMDKLVQCSTTKWSSLAPDPKSDLYIFEKN